MANNNCSHSELFTLILYFMPTQHVSLSLSMGQKLWASKDLILTFQLTLPDGAWHLQPILRGSNTFRQGMFQTSYFLIIDMQDLKNAWITILIQT